MKLDEIANKAISFRQSIKKKAPIKRIIETKLIENKNDPAFQFEIDAFNFLLANRKDLNIKRLYALKNSLIDCYLTTVNGKSIAVEFKFALNWNKSNVARSQIINFSNYETDKKLDLQKPDFGLVIFSGFSNDWKRFDGKRDLENGWLRFYEDQLGYDRFIKIHILQLTDNQLTNPGFE